jgi:hypothetical protein
LALEVRRLGLDGASSTSLAAEDASEGAGEGDGTLFLVDAELTALADLRGGISTGCMINRLLKTRKPFVDLSFRDASLSAVMSATTWSISPIR